MLKFIMRVSMNIRPPLTPPCSGADPKTEVDGTSLNLLRMYRSIQIRYVQLRSQEPELRP